MRTTRISAVAGTFLASTLILAGCTGDTEPAGDGGSQPVATPPPVVEETTEPAEPAEPTDDAAAPVPGDVPAEYQGVIAAIILAEAEAGGPAFELDDGDDGIWEVHIAVGSDDIEVQVTGDGTTVLSAEREADLGSDDAEGIAGATVSLEEAVRIAIAEYGGTSPVDDAGLSREADGSFAWEVAFESDIEVYLSTTTGAIIRIES